MAQYVVVITGCSSGIGLATAINLGSDPQQRYKVYASVRNLENSNELNQEAGNCLNKTIFIKEVDVCDDVSVHRFVGEVIRDEGKIDVLINNAGIGLLGLFELTPMDKVKRLYDVNVFGAMRMVQTCLPHMKERKSGHIIFLSTIFGSTIRSPFGEVYSSSKFAVEGFAMTLAPLLHCFNIKVTVLAPGPVQTPILRNAIKNGMTAFPSEEHPVDDVTNKLFAKYQTGIGKFFQTPQPVNKIGQVVRDILCAEKPHFRHFTRDEDVEIAKHLFVDPTGDHYLQRVNDAFATDGVLH